MLSADHQNQALAITAGRPLRLRYASPGRMYALVLDQDLFGDWYIMMSWGGRHTSHGGGKTVFVESFEAGKALLLRMTKRREQHGYQRLE